MTAAERERLFVDLFSANKARLLRLCRSYLASPADAEDLYQDIMVNVWRSLPAFRGDARITTWLFRIAVNTALIHQRRHKRARRVIQPVSGALPEVAVEAAPDGSGAQAQEHRLARLQQAIASLPEIDRLIVALVLEGLSYHEISQITGITSNYAGVRISRIKRALEKRMKDLDDGL